MEIIEYYKSTAQDYWQNQIKAGDWSAAELLYQWLRDNKLKDICGAATEVYLLIEGKNLVSFAILAEQDEIEAPELTPWIGFVYTFPAYRGQHRAGELLAHICQKLQAKKVPNVYVSTEEIGLYEKYGFRFLQMMTTREGKTTRVYIKDLSIAATDKNK